MAINEAAPLADPLVDKHDVYFRTDHLKTDLGGRTARGGAVTVVSQALKFLISMVGTVVLARLLTPQDYGLIGMVAVVIGFVSMFKDLGLSTATIQRPEITNAQISTLFWINLALSVGVMLVAAAIAPAIARFYHEPRLVLITLAYGCGFLLGGLTVQHEALLRRQMRFTALAGAEVFSIVASVVTAIVMARFGAGYWALVGGALSLNLAYLIGIWAQCRWRPGLPAKDSGVRSMLVFGGNFTAFSVVNYFARNLDNMLIGWRWGAAPLGLYAKAYQLLLLPLDQINSPITAVAVPALSRLADDAERYRQAYLRILEKIAIMTMPMMAFMIVTSDWLVFILLGPKWSGVSRIFALLAIAGFVQPVTSTTGWLFLTQGRPHHMFQWGLVGSSLIVVSIAIGLPWGPVGVATSYSLGFVCITMPLLLWFVGRTGPVGARHIYLTVAPIVFASLCGLLAALGLRRFSGVANPVLGILSCLSITVLSTLLVLVVMPAGRRVLLDLRKSFFLLLKGKGPLVQAS
jgi:O-antigen/teichoic acid export membrane protein